MRTMTKGGALTKLAGIWCNEREFREFVERQAGKRWDGTGTVEGFCAAWVRQVCGVASRAELDYHRAAEEKFHQHVRLPYMRWRQGVRGHD